ncbi:RNA pyrophosphohydrolase [Pseudooceanicola sp.]|uniref:RNA pyrophosphohydrolase n=1 Tax=Pseudooceanicola sp. TaxID=1914328 RepID=UPI0040589A30
MTPEEIARLPYRRNVGVMLANRHGQIWVGQRLDYEGPAWQMPQGGIDRGEDARAAALRELEEETGIGANLVAIEAETAGWHAYDLPHDLVPKLWKGRFRGQEQKWFLMRFRGTDGDVDIRTEHPEFSEWKWIDSDALLSTIVPFKRSVYEVVLAELGGHLQPR